MTSFIFIHREKRIVFWFKILHNNSWTYLAASERFEGWFTEFTVMLFYSLIMFTVQWYVCIYLIVYIYFIVFMVYNRFHLNVLLIMFQIWRMVCIIDVTKSFIAYAATATAKIWLIYCYCLFYVLFTLL